MEGYEAAEWDTRLSGVQGDHSTNIGRDGYRYGFNGITTLIDTAYRFGALTVFLSVLFVIYIYIHTHICMKYIFL